MSLRLENVSFGFPRAQVLSSVSTEALPTGRITALLGPNAAGKSTLFRCIAGVLTPRQGAIWLNNQDLLSASRLQRMQQVCYMPQIAHSSAAITVFEAVLLAKKHMHDWRVSADDADAVEAVLVQFGIAELAQRYINELSGGQQQIVSLCQALVRSADLVLLDEPTSALDLQHQLNVLHTISTLTEVRESVTLISLHDLNLAARFADHIVLLNKGEVVISGPTEQVLESPQLANTYGVNIELKRASDSAYMVSATRRV